MKASGEVCGIVTEENEEIISFEDNLSRDAKYIFLMDPLDGSSNIDVNVSVGTIFSVYRRLSPVGHKAEPSDFLQQGTKMVAAGYVIFHRNLLKGGIFLYPSSPASPNGKPRPTYECNPIAFIAEQAGGKASDGKTRILDYLPESLHQRVPFYAGSHRMVDMIEEMIKENTIP